MRKLFILVIIILLIVGRAVWIEKNQPNQWRYLWQNYQDTQSIAQLAKQTFDVMRGVQLKKAMMSEKEKNTIVYKWTDERGEIHMSYQKPIGVPNVQEIRLGDLNYQVTDGLTDKELNKVLSKDKN